MNSCFPLHKLENGTGFANHRHHPLKNRVAESILSSTIMDGKATAGSSPVVAAKWGTQQMGAPSTPPTHPENQQAAAHWGPHRADEERPPYVLFEPEPNHRQGTGVSPMESILDAFNSWTRKAETLSSNVWQNLKTASSMTDAAWGKVSLTAKALTEGGFETLYRQTFPTDPSDRVKKTFACYLSTNTGPVAGTLYLTTANVAFCSDRPLSFAAPSGQQAWSYYKVLIPLPKVATVNPVTVKENPPEKYIQIVTVDGHEFWFMGFVSYEKATTHLLNAVSDGSAARRTAEVPVSGSLAVKREVNAVSDGSAARREAKVPVSGSLAEKGEVNAVSDGSAARREAEVPVSGHLSEKHEVNNVSK